MQRLKTALTCVLLAALILVSVSVVLLVRTATAVVAAVPGEIQATRFEADLIESAAALGSVALDGAADLVVEQGIGHGLVGIVDTAGDQRPVEIAFEESDYHLLADARKKECAPLLPSPALGHRHPTSVVLVAFPQLIPVEMDSDAAVLIGPDFLSGLAHNGGGLRSVDSRPRGGARYRRKPAPACS